MLGATPVSPGTASPARANCRIAPALAGLALIVAFHGIAQPWPSGQTFKFRDSRRATQPIRHLVSTAPVSDSPIVEPAQRHRYRRPVLPHPSTPNTFTEVSDGDGGQRWDWRHFHANTDKSGSNTTFSPYTSRVTTTERPEQAIDRLDSQRNRERKIWFSEPFGIHERDSRDTLHVYHTPEMHEVDT